MKNKRGFTLTEVLLAVMIVGIIGVALASLTTAASRESGRGSSRVMLRNNASLALKQLRKDVHDASRVVFVKGVLPSTLGTDREPLLVLANNLSLLDGKIDNEALGPEFIAYCFSRGETTETSSGDQVQPEGYSYDEGTITREVWVSDEIPTAATACPSDNTDRTVRNWLQHVKFISSSYMYGNPAVYSYPVPLFSLVDFNGNSHNNTTSALNQGAVLDIKMILELPSLPVVNVAIEERILLTNGGKLSI